MSLLSLRLTRLVNPIACLKDTRLRLRARERERQERRESGKDSLIDLRLANLCSSHCMRQLISSDDCVLSGPNLFQFIDTKCTAPLESMTFNTHELMHEPATTTDMNNSSLGECIHPFNEPSSHRKGAPLFMLPSTKQCKLHCSITGV